MKAVGVAPSPLTRVIFHLLFAKFEALADVVPELELIACTTNFPPPPHAKIVGMNTPPFPNGIDLV